MDYPGGGACKVQLPLLVTAPGTAGHSKEAVPGKQAAAVAPVARRGKKRARVKVRFGVAGGQAATEVCGLWLIGLAGERAS